MNIIDLMAEHQVSVSFCPKVIWLNKASDKVSVASPDLCIKLSNYSNDRAKVLTEGLRLLGIEV
jgi:hypothetical protein